MSILLKMRTSQLCSPVPCTGCIVLDQWLGREWVKRGFENQHGAFICYVHDTLLSLFLIWVFYFQYLFRRKKGYNLVSPSFHLPFRHIYAPIYHTSSVQFSCSVMSDSLQWTAGCQASLSITNFRSLLTHVHRVGDAIPYPCETEGQPVLSWKLLVTSCTWPH